MNGSAMTTAAVKLLNTNDVFMICFLMREADIMHKLRSPAEMAHNFSLAG
jgi:hypothetical protein